MKFPLTLLLAVLLCFPFVGKAQTDKPLTPEEKKAKLEESALSFLRETYSDVGNMRLLENRISFTSELASLLWYKDQKNAAAMFGSAIADFKQLLAVCDGQMNAFGPKTYEDHDPMAGLPFMGEPTDRGQIEKKFRNALGVRQQIAMSIAEHEPELAYNFFYDSVSVISNPEFRKQIESSDSNYEHRLISRIAETNTKQATELGKRSLAKGFSSEHVALLRRLYTKDPDRAIEFGQAVLSLLKSTSVDKLSDSQTAELLRFATENLAKSKVGTGKKSVYSESEVREIAELLARMVLNPGDVYDADDALRYASAIEKVLPSRAAQIRAKYATKNDNGRDSGRSASTGGVPPPMYKGPVNVTGTGSDSGTIDPALKARLEQQEKDREALEEVKRLGTAELPKEERDKIISKTREILGRTKSKTQKIAGLSGLAAAIAKLGDKKLAGEIMLEAEQLVVRQPKNYLDLMNSWAFGTGYLAVDPDKAFQVFDDVVFKTNELVAAGVKIAEFVDVNEEVIADGEFQVGAFGGQMIQTFTRSAGIADSAIKVMIDADFEKTKALTNRFDRTELRVLAKLMVLRTVLGKEITQEQYLEEMFGEDAIPPDVIDK